MIYAMEYYGNNDYRDYLAHHGVKGMKWGKHLFGLLGGNYRDQYRSYSSKSSALKKNLGSINRVASGASSYASNKQKSYKSATNKANYLKGVSKNLTSTSNRYITNASEIGSKRKTAQKTKLSENARASEVLRNEERRRSQDAYRSKMNALSPVLWDANKKKPIEISKSSTYDSKDRTDVPIKKTAGPSSLSGMTKKAFDDAINSKYGASFANKQKYDSHRRSSVKAEREKQTNSSAKQFANKVLAKGYENLANEYANRFDKASKTINKNVTKAKNNYELASTVSKKANALVNSTNSAISNADKKASEAKSKWEKSAANKVSQVLKRFTGALSSVGANVINRGRSIIDRFLRRKKKNS